MPDSVALAWLPPRYATYTSPVTGASADLTVTGENFGTGPPPDRMSGTATAAATTTAAAAAARPIRRLRARCDWLAFPPGLAVLVPRGGGESAAAVGRSARPGGTAAAWVAGCSADRSAPAAGSYGCSPAAARSASANARQLGYLSAGSLASARASTPSTAPGRSGHHVVSFGGGSESWA